ncbi:MAG: hypothetical protein EPN38_07190, partial [Rhodanobacteraceae bacterium]
MAASLAGGADGRGRGGWLRLRQRKAGGRNRDHAAAGAVRNRERRAIIEILRGDSKAALASAQKELSPWRDGAVALALRAGTRRAAGDAALKKLMAGYARGAPCQTARVYALRPGRRVQVAGSRLEHPRSRSRLPAPDPLILRYRNAPRFAAFCRNARPPGTTDAVAMKLQARATAWCAEKPSPSIPLPSEGGGLVSASGGTGGNRSALPLEGGGLVSASGGTGGNRSAL